MHPTNSDYIAAATSSGAYLSSDGGATFKSITAAREIGTAVFFNEENLYYASYDTHPKLVKYNIESGEKESLNLPELTEDGDRKSTRLNSSHVAISYAVFCLKKNKYGLNSREIGQRQIRNG